MSIQELLLEKAKLNKLINENYQAILNYVDGFEYMVCVHSYGSHFRRVYKNSHAALIAANEYNEDNGFAHIYTTNPDLKIRLNGGVVYLVQSTKNIQAKTHPRDAILLSPN